MTYFFAKLIKAASTHNKTKSWNDMGRVRAVDDPAKIGVLVSKLRWLLAIHLTPQHIARGWWSHGFYLHDVAGMTDLPTTLIRSIVASHGIEIAKSLGVDWVKYSHSRQYTLRSIVLGSGKAPNER